MKIVIIMKMSRPPIPLEACPSWRKQEIRQHSYVGTCKPCQRWSTKAAIQARQVNKGKFVPMRLDQRCETPTIANRRAHLDNDVIVYRRRPDDIHHIIIMWHRELSSPYKSQQGTWHTQGAPLQRPSNFSASNVDIVHIINHALCRCKNRIRIGRRLMQSNGVISSGLKDKNGEA